MERSQSLAQQKCSNSTRIKSCNNCRKKKLKCDKKLPCSRCSKKNEGQTCKYESSHAATRSIRNSRSPTEEVTNHGRNSPKEGSAELSKRQKRQFSYHGVSTFIKEFLKEDYPSDYPFNFLFKHSPRLPEDLKSFCQHIPPYQICVTVCDIYFGFLGTLFDVVSKSKMDAVLQNFFQNVFEVSDLILLFSALSLAFKLHNLPETALNYCDNIRLTPKGLAEEYYDKVEKLIELNSFMIHPISIEVLQHLVLHAAKDFLDPSPEKILNLTRAIHYLDGIISEGSHSSATPEEIWKLTMTLKNIDSLVCIFFQTSPFMQKDIVEAQLVRLNNSFSETMFQKLLNSLCNQGLAMYKSARYLSVEEYIHNVNENEVKISLLLMEIDLKAYTPQNPMSKIQCFFLKYVLWTLKVLLYQPVITLSDEDFDKVQLLKEKLAESLVYCFRLSMDSFQEICEVGAPSFFFFDTLKKIFSLLFCRNEKYSYRNELFESMKLMKQLALKIDLAYSLKIIDDLTTISNCVYQKDYTKAGDLGDFEAIDSEIDHFCEFLFSNFYENSFSSI